MNEIKKSQPNGKKSQFNRKSQTQINKHIHTVTICSHAPSISSRSLFDHVYWYRYYFWGCIASVYCWLLCIDLLLVFGCLVLCFCCFFLCYDGGSGGEQSLMWNSVFHFRNDKFFCLLNSFQYFTIFTVHMAWHCTIIAHIW